MEKSRGWPALLSLAVHELRTPMTVVSGYLRMVLKERAGPVPDEQRRLLEEAERSSHRLASLVAELSDLANLERGQAAFNRQALAFFPLVDEVADRHRAGAEAIRIDVRGPGGGTATVHGDPVRLRAALDAVLGAILRDRLDSSDPLVIDRSLREYQGRPVAWVIIGDAAAVVRLGTASPRQLGPFDEYRGGAGLSLAVARRTIEAHEGRLWSARGKLQKTSAVLCLPVVT